MSGMLELGMATMFRDEMSRAVEADFEQVVCDHYAKAINMAKTWNEIKQSRDHYRNEGLCQNALVKELLGKPIHLKSNLRMLKGGTEL